MNYIRLPIFIAILCALAQVNATWAQTKSTDETPTAKELWELAIAAKGGREALYKITSIADLDNQTGKFCELIVMPDRYFYWLDWRSSPFGLIYKLYNLETGFGCDSAMYRPMVYKDIRTKLELPKDLGNYPPEFLEFLLYHLLETRWLTPKPLIASKMHVNGKRIDRVDVLIKAYGRPVRYAIFLDEKTHLPVRVMRCENVNTDNLWEMWRIVDYRKYVPIKGIMIPTEVSYNKKKWRPNNIELNVDFDPHFFDRVPDDTKNGLQWRKAATLTTDVKTVLTPLSDADVTKYLTDLQSENAEVQQVAVRELGSTGKQVESQLDQLLTTGSAQQRYHAAVLLLQLEEQQPKAIEVLSQLVIDRQLSPEYRQDATFGLLRSDQGIQLLAGLLNYPSVQVRRFVIFAFDQLTERAELPPIIETVLPAIRTATKDSDDVVRGMAKEVLRQVKKHPKR
jgi:hypothetical protein